MNKNKKPALVVPTNIVIQVNPKKAYVIRIIGKDRNGNMKEKNINFATWFPFTQATSDRIMDAKIAMQNGITKNLSLTIPGPRLSGGLSFKLNSSGPGH